MAHHRLVLPLLIVVLICFQTYDAFAAPALEFIKGAHVVEMHPSSSDGVIRLDGNQVLIAPPYC